LRLDGRPARTDEPHFKMYPHSFHAFGLSVAVWDAVFLLAVFGGYFLFRNTLGHTSAVRWPGLRYALIVYLSALSAQLFAYLFDANTSLAPPPDVSAAAYYLSPIAGPKTLYGVIVLLPVSIALAMLGTRLPLPRALDLTTPALFFVLAVARVGCLLQGCCYGMRSETFGIAFPPKSPVYYDQMNAGIIAAGAAPLPVFPAQAVEALFLLAVAAWSFRRVHAGRSEIFLFAIVAYSIFRFLIEFVRADAERGFYGPLATSQWIAGLVLLVAGAVLAQRSQGRDEVAA